MEEALDKFKGVCYNIGTNKERWFYNMATKVSRVGEEEKRQIIEMYANGCGDSVYAIVSKTGRTYKTIQKVLKDAGVYIENQDWLKSHQGVSASSKATNHFIKNAKIEEPKKEVVKEEVKHDERGISIDSFMSKLSASSIKTSKPASGNKSKVNKKNVFTRAEKIDYCDRVYGAGNWEFMSLSEVREQLKKDLKIGVG